MSRIVYNEGRVVGYSAYEIYVKQFKQTNSGGTPATEREWLASSIASGSSLLLYVARDNVSGPHRRDFTFPEGSRLRAANTIVASFFDGEAMIKYNGSEELGDQHSGFAVRVTDYGKLIANNSTYSPSENDSNNIPDYMNGTDFNNAYSDPNHPYLEDIKLSRLMQYIKIDDGIVLQGGTWDEPSDPAQHKSPPKKRFRLVAPRDDNTTTDTPLSNLSSPPRPRIRIAFADQVTQGFYILLTGFTDRAVIEGVTGLTTSTATTSPENGDFLGPAVFPWSAKIIFSQPANLTYYLRQGEFTSEVNRTQDSLVMIENSKDEPTTTIKINPTKVVGEGIEAGTGIQIQEKDGKMVVSSPSDADFITIYSDVNKRFMMKCRFGLPSDNQEDAKQYITDNIKVNYTVCGLNGFTSYDENASDSSAWISMPTASTQYSTNGVDNYNMRSVDPCLKMKILPSTSKRSINGVDLPTSVTIKISGSFPVNASDIVGNQYLNDNGIAETRLGYASLAKPDFYYNYTKIDDVDTYSGFGLKHADLVTTGHLYPCMFGIGFDIADGEYTYLHNIAGDGKFLYKFVDTSSSAIWNLLQKTVTGSNMDYLAIQGTPTLPKATVIEDNVPYEIDYTHGGASWEATCALQDNPFYGGTGAITCPRILRHGVQNSSSGIGSIMGPSTPQENVFYFRDLNGTDIRLIATANAYADGYNTQLTGWDKLAWSVNGGEKTGKGAGLWAKHLNISLSGIFYLRENV